MQCPLPKPEALLCTLGKKLNNWIFPKPTCRCSSIRSPLSIRPSTHITVIISRIVCLLEFCPLLQQSSSKESPMSSAKSTTSRHGKGSMTRCTYAIGPRSFAHIAATGPQVVEDRVVWTLLQQPTVLSPPLLALRIQHVEFTPSRQCDELFGHPDWSSTNKSHRSSENWWNERTHYTQLQGSLHLTSSKDNLLRGHNQSTLSSVNSTLRHTWTQSIRHHRPWFIRALLKWEKRT